MVLKLSLFRPHPTRGPLGSVTTPASGRIEVQCSEAMGRDYVQHSPQRIANEGRVGLSREA